ncbi:MAG: cytochrome C oxidase subunit IV family protein [Bryobacteraceae bacterium]|nr:cytochrome C oxidase subunit IV family protein [Bryobacteraceae bacterium]MDW8380259.1 cytochrome C oxidase subunit IV family protein [Bryobacterales bacterium]
MEGHITPTKTYLAVFFALMVCTVLTYYVWTIDLGFFNVVVALGIAVFKASLVVTYFMHVKWSPILSKITVAISVIFLGILLLLTSMDYASRQWVPRNVGWENYPVLK